MLGLGTFAPCKPIRTKEVRVSVPTPDSNPQSELRTMHFLWKLELENGQVLAFDDTVCEWEETLCTRKYTVVEERDFGEAFMTLASEVKNVVDTGRTDDGARRVVEVDRLARALDRIVVRLEMDDYRGLIVMIWRMGASRAYRELLEWFTQYVEVALRGSGRHEEQDAEGEKMMRVRMLCQPKLSSLYIPLNEEKSDEDEEYFTAEKQEQDYGWGLGAD